MQKKKLEAKFRKFCNELSPKDRVAVIHHSDADGICSGVIAAKAVERLSGKKPVAVMPYEYGNQAQASAAKKAMGAKKANKLVITDIGIDSAPHSLKQFSPFEKCLVIDHHKTYKDLNSKKVVFLKAQNFTKKDPSGYVASKFAFDLFGKVTNVKDLDWVACLGILGDMSLKRWRPFVQKTLKRKHVSLTTLYKCLGLIAAVEVMANKSIPKLFWQFYKAKSPKQVLASPFKRHLERFKAKRDALVEGFEEKAEFFPQIELYFYAIRSKHENIKSYVINQISEVNPDKTVILIQYLGQGRIRFSARRQDFKVRVNELLRKAIKGIPEASAGGHAPAAAGSMPRHALNRFKSNIVRILEKEYNS